MSSDNSPYGERKKGIGTYPELLIISESPYVPICFSASTIHFITLGMASGLMETASTPTSAEALVSNRPRTVTVPPLQFPHIQGKPVELASEVLRKGPIGDIIATQVNAKPFFPPLETCPFQQRQNRLGLRRMLAIEDHEMEVGKSVVMAHASKRLAIGFAQVPVRAPQVGTVCIQCFFKLLTTD